MLVIEEILATIPTSASGSPKDEAVRAAFACTWLSQNLAMVVLGLAKAECPADGTLLLTSASATAPPSAVVQLGLRANVLAICFCPDSIVCRAYGASAWTFRRHPRGLCVRSVCLPTALAPASARRPGCCACKDSLDAIDGTCREGHTCCVKTWIQATDSCKGRTTLCVMRYALCVMRYALCVMDFRKSTMLF